MLKSLGVVVMAGALIAAPAKASCWTPQQVAAAKVRDFDTMLMVSALRCRFGDAAMVERYNTLVTRHRVALTEANDRLRHHFSGGGTKASAAAYDGYVTHVANRYGAGVAGLSCADMSSIVDAAIAEEPTLDALVAIAERAAVDPVLDEAQCPIEVALVQ